MKDFKLIDQFKGYVTKPDETNTSARFLVSGSQNVLIDDQAKVASRKGYTLDGAAGSETSGIYSSFVWATSTGDERPLRVYDDSAGSSIIQARYVALDDSINWVTLSDKIACTDVQWATWWAASDGLDRLLFVVGNTNLYEWNGAMTQLASATSNTITKTGTKTWAEDRFNTSGTKTLSINGTAYTYTGGESTDTLTGVTPDPSGIAVNSIIFQTIKTNADKPANKFNNDLIATLNNHVYIASNDWRDVYVSQNDDYTDFTFASPRIVGEGAILTLDSAPKGFVVQEESMYISAGPDDWYKTTFTLSDDNTAEQLDIDKLKTAPRQGALSQGAIANIKNNVAFVSHEPTVDTLGRLEDVDTPQSKPLSDMIKPDMEGLTTSDVHAKYWKNAVYFAFPTDGKVYIYDLDKGYWQPPQSMAIARVEVIGGELYGHSSVTNETHKLFADNTYTDNDGLYTSKAIFAYRNYGKRAWKKSFNEYYTEGYIAPSTVIDVTIDYDYQGSGGSTTYEISGTNTSLLFGSTIDNSLGKVSFGKNPLGGSVDTIPELYKFRSIKEVAKQDFYEQQITYESTSDEARWEILAHGPNATLSKFDNTFIKH